MARPTLMKSSGKSEEKEIESSQENQEEQTIKEMEEQIQVMNQEIQLFKEIENLAKPEIFRYNLILTLQKTNESLKLIGQTLVNIGTLLESKDEE